MDRMITGPRLRCEYCGTKSVYSPCCRCQASNSNELNKKCCRGCGFVYCKGKYEVCKALARGQLVKVNEIEYYHEKTGMELVLISGGSFQMAVNYKVSLSPYLIGKYQCTQEQWEKVMGNNPSRFKGAKNPVETISWNDCLEFCKKTGLLLPSEAQWEYAARAGSTKAYCFGNEESKLEEYAWYDENSECKTHKVGQKKPNAYGLYGMHGNVSEWCQDWHGNYPEKTLENPKGSPKGTCRVLRGGDFCRGAYFCTSSFRSGYWPVNADCNVGVRFVSLY